MKKLFILLVTGALLASCTQKPQGPTQAEYDALAQVKDSLATQMTELQDLIGSVTASLDSIDTQEGLLFVNNEDGTKASKRQLMDRIQNYKDLLARQRTQLEKLENQAKSDKANIRELRTIIGRLRQEIHDKEVRIAELENDLTNRKKDIAQLEKTLAKSEENTANMTKARDALQDVADYQKQVINTAYFVVGSKSMLRDLGLIKGVFKQKADYANLDNTKFTKVDIRDFKELNINSKKAKLITEKPANSYLLIENPDETTTLRITDPDAFWESSQYLIIQTK
ncbi:MAG: hypothetical protein IKX59_01465 [Bacteroidales bacterium]|nr:hypothetical protein [Bacteroidales bacterium]